MLQAGVDGRIGPKFDCLFNASLSCAQHGDTISPLPASAKDHPWNCLSDVCGIGQIPDVPTEM
jgi:hypothetical protein